MVTLTDAISIYDDAYPRLDLFKETDKDRATKSMRKGQLGPDVYLQRVGEPAPGELVRDYESTRISLAKEAKAAGWGPDVFLRWFDGPLPEGIWG